ncbi:putative isomerase YbhE [Teratosphaeria nubilosa]|uniref:Putative isomerase YbhE n=1 Tax=Teratosphaeria nubilosa TaxID=161662 RepID=A0A6G1KVW9_9PEZI|nr:putative isomerase YbhE [Teratosphaeria nubilosa]
MLASFTLLALTARAVTATNLFVSDYAGQITSFSLTAKNGAYALDQTFVNGDCAPNPSWLTIDADRGLLYCLNEGLDTVNGSLSSFTINSDGSIDHIKNETTISGPVSGVLYGPAAGQRAIALAHYTGSAVSSWLVYDNGSLSLNQNIPYTLSQPGPDASRQNASHEHEAILDPTGQYILVPDLGADLVRVFCFDKESLQLKALEPLKAAAGSGPRHGAFWNPYSVVSEDSTTYFYLVAELASTVTGYAVQYLPNNGGLSFTKVYESTTYGLLNLPEGNAPAEIHVTPDNRFLIISNRNNTSFSLPSAKGTLVPSDSLSTFALQTDGTLVFHQLWPSGGSYPRHFSTNAVGDLVAVGNQYSQNVVILLRDTATGLIGEPVARVTVGGNTTCVVFDEQKALGVLGG